MSWPTDTIDTQHTDAGTDKPKLARAELNDALVAVKAIIAGRGTVNGVAALDASGVVPDAQLPATALAVPWQTGNVRMLLGTTAASGWIIWDNGSIGNASSAATTRANADTSALFTLLWDTYDNATCATQTSAGAPVARGASAAADYAANRRLVLPPGPGRVLGVAGSGAGLTSRVNGDSVGEEDHVLTQSEMPSHSHPYGASAGVTTGGTSIVGNTGSGFSTVSVGSSAAHNTMQPTFFLNFEVKL